MVPFERAMVVSYRLSIVTVALSVTIRPQFAIEYLRRSNQQGVGHFGAKFGEEEVGLCKQNVNAISERHEAIVCRRKRVYIFCRLSTMQTDRQTDQGLVTSIATGEIACQRCHLKCNKLQKSALYIWFCDIHIKA